MCESHQTQLALALPVLLLVSGCHPREDDGNLGADEYGAGDAGGASGLSSGSQDRSEYGSDDGADDDDDDRGVGVGGIKFDVPKVPDAVSGCDLGGRMDPRAEFSYIWIANSGQGTVSKIDTRSGVEEGRYHAGASNMDPSRTSVNLYGDAAAVNRNGSVIKIAARERDCVDKNGNGMIDTSSGPTDLLPWGQDECVLWSIDVPGWKFGPRPVAWEPKVDIKICAPDPNARLWVGFGADTQSHVWRLDGTSGALLDEVLIGEVTKPYGGASNREGDFWFTTTHWEVNTSDLVFVDGTTLQYRVIPRPAEPSEYYGMALDKNGSPWMAGHFSNAFWRFDPGSQQVHKVGHAPQLRGMMIDRNGYAWAAHNNGCGIARADATKNVVLDTNIPLPGCVRPVGIAIDVDGYVWAVDRKANKAFKIDPMTLQVVLTVDGLQSPYTYSDMTGAGLGLVADPPR